MIAVMSASAFLWLSPNPAHADVDAQKVIDALKAQFAGNGMTFDVTSAELSGSNVLAKGASLKLSGAEPMKLGDMVLENVAEDGAGYIVGKVSTPPVESGEGDTKVSFGGASIKNLHIAGPAEADPVKKLFLYEGVDVGAIKVSTQGKEMFRMDGATATMSAYQPTSPMTFDMKFSGIYGNLADIPDPQAKQAFAAMGYSEINGQFTGKGTWNPADGRMVLSEMAYDFKDVGRLNMTFDISGYTADFVKKVQEMNKSMEGKDDGAKSLAMLGTFQQLTFNSMSIRFDDASVSGRVLDYASKQTGQPRDAIVAQAKAVVPIALMKLQDADFMQKASEAVAAFLENPKSLEVKAAPAAPVSFAVLAASGYANPAAVVKQLAVTVTANQ
jgi:hypothetical protein